MVQGTEMAASGERHKRGEGAMKADNNEATWGAESGNARGEKGRKHVRKKGWGAKGGNGREGRGRKGVRQFAFVNCHTIIKHLHNMPRLSVEKRREGEGGPEPRNAQEGEEGAEQRSARERNDANNEYMD